MSLTFIYTPKTPLIHNFVDKDLKLMLISVICDQVFIESTLFHILAFIYNETSPENPRFGWEFASGVQL